MTFAVRDMTEHDVPVLDALLRAAYETSRSLAPRLRTAFTSGASRTFVADGGDGPIGMATLHDYGTIGYVSLVGVAPEHQAKGVGRRLMEVLIADSDRRAHRALALESSDEGRHLYHTLGFSEFGATITVESPAAIDVRAERAGVRRARGADRDAVYACDERAFGGDRSATIGPWFECDDHVMYVVPEGTGVSGYAVVRDGRIAPWVASSPLVATVLFDAAVTALGGEPARISVPADNAAAVDLMTRRGWHERFRNAHMVRGAPLRFPRSSIYGLISLGEG
jgi:N-acetylglutamate synthase-like GNAT family acetyltransferase